MINNPYFCETAELLSNINTKSNVVKFFKILIVIYYDCFIFYKFFPHRNNNF